MSLSPDRGLCQVLHSGSWAITNMGSAARQESLVGTTGYQSTKLGAKYGPVLKSQLALAASEAAVQLMGGLHASSMGACP
jgi:hypothetical protein